MIRTGYTVTVETARRKYLFTDKATSSKCFAAAATLKADVMRCGVDPGAFRPRNITYHDIGARVAASCWCIDIRSAYPTALRNMGAISNETYWKLGKLDKLDRLKAVGMLASRKFVQEYHGGRLVAQRIEEATTAPYFYAACHEIGSVMSHVKETNDGGFLLFWVDGVFVDVADPAPIADTLKAMGYDTSVERVTDIRRSADGRYYHYTKGAKRTYICLPRRVQYDDAELVESLHQASTL